MPPLSEQETRRRLHVAFAGSKGEDDAQDDDCDERRGDAIPVGRIGALEAHSSEQHRVVHDAIGRQYKICQETLRRMPIRRARLAKRAVEYLTHVCRKTQNTHLLDDAGQILGRAGHMKEGKAVFSQALELDPYAFPSQYR